nr:WRKY1 transcription factor [Tanacetum cinerariifolium]
MQTQTSNTLHKAIMEAGSKDRPPMLAPEHPSDTKVFTVKMEILLESTSNKLLHQEGFALNVGGFAFNTEKDLLPLKKSGEDGDGSRVNVGLGVDNSNSGESAKQREPTDHFPATSPPESLITIASPQSVRSEFTNPFLDQQGLNVVSKKRYLALEDSCAALAKTYGCLSLSYSSWHGTYGIRVAEVLKYVVFILESRLAIKRWDEYGFVIHPEAEHDRENITKTSTLPSDSTPRVTSLAADEGSMQHKLQELTDLCTRLIKHLEERNGGHDDPSGEDATIKGRRLKIGEEAAIERSTEKGSDDTEEMVNFLTSLDAASILTSGVQVSVPPAAEVPTISILPAGEVPTSSSVVPTASPIFTTATVTIPYSRRKGKEKMVELETPKKKKLQEQIDVQMARQNNETVSMYLQEYEQFAAELSIEERIELIIDLESAKKVKTSEEVLEEDLKEMMQLVPVEEVYVEALQLWALVKETLSIRPATSDKEKELWLELKRLYEPDVEDQLWTQTQALMHALVEWRLYDSCGVHHILSRDQEIFMLVEKECPLRNGLAIVMISYKLQVENYSQMASKAFHSENLIADGASSLGEDCWE